MTGPRTSLLTDLDVYDVAHLAGGVGRLSDTAVVALLGRGALRVGTTGLLAATGGRPGHPVEAAVLDAVGPRPRCSAASLRRLVERDPRVVAVTDRLLAEGLLRRRWLAVLSDGSPALVPTAAGRRVLRQEGAEPGSSGPREVALHGTAAMDDRALCRSVFGPADAADAAGPTRPRGRTDRYGGDRGSFAPFVGWGGGADGGGCWGGGDGGGGGGGDGGGGC